MADMLVKLYDFRPDAELIKRLGEQGIFIKRVIAPEKTVVCDWVLSTFGTRWRDECDVAISNQPVSCYIAYRGKEILGFACCEATFRNFFGPTGVLESMRGKGIGKALLFACLDHQKNMGYAYSIIGSSGADGFYEKSCNAVSIERSKPGIYKDML